MIKVRDKSECRWDLVSLGEVMLRFDPGDDRIHTTRSFRVCEGGGEYNVARGLSYSFRFDTAIVTALADNQIGRLVEDLIRQGGVDTSQIIWRETDGIGRNVRNGVYFIERGFGLRSPVGCSDRANTAVSQLTQGEIDWGTIFNKNGARWFHTGGIFAGLSDTAPEVAREAMQAARESGAVVSFDLNYRDSLWSGRGGREAADKINSDLLQFADVVFGVTDFDATLADYSEMPFRSAAADMMNAFPNLKLVATTLRDVLSASRHDLSGACFDGSEVVKAADMNDLDVLDRVGSGDAFAAGLIYGVLEGKDLQSSVNYGTAAAALTLASLGDGSTAMLVEIERAMRSSEASVLR
jgi:2-dehydro-3-deoxygluconokinase